MQKQEEQRDDEGWATSSAYRFRRYRRRLENGSILCCVYRSERSGHGIWATACLCNNKIWVYNAISMIYDRGIMIERKKEKMGKMGFQAIKR